MKKVYLGLFALSFSFAGVGQTQLFHKDAKAKNFTQKFVTLSSKDKKADYTAKASYFEEDFENWPLTGWTIQGGPLSTTTSPDQKWHEYTNGNPGKSAAVLYVNSVDVHDEQLITPEISLPAGGNYYFSFDFNTSIYWHALTLGGSFNNADIYLQVSSDDGANWSPILWQEDDIALLDATYSNGWQTYEWMRAYVNVSAYAGENVKFRFTYKGQDAAQFSIDNVSVEDIPLDDISVTSFQLAVPTAEAGDYYMIPTSQVDFPGLTFGANVQNIGAADQANVTLVATGPSYNETSSAIVVNVGQNDSLSITTPYMIPAAVGTYNLNVTTSLGANTDANTSNNQTSYEIKRDAHVYARDNGVITGAITQVSSQTNESLSIGNVMEVFNDMTVTGVQIRIGNQEAAVGQPIDARIQILNADGTDFVHLALSEIHEIQESDLNTFVTIPLEEGAVTIPGGSLILVMARHYGGDDPVGFGMAQTTIQGSVMGRTDDNSLFNLTSPSAIMIRLTEDPSVAVSKVANLEGVKVYPNPTSGLINISNDTNVENTIVVTDLTGKVVASKVTSTATSIELNNAGAGVYLVEVSNANGKKVERVIVK